MQTPNSISNPRGCDLYHVFFVRSHFIQNAQNSHLMCPNRDLAPAKDGCRLFVDFPSNLETDQQGYQKQTQAVAGLSLGEYTAICGTLGGWGIGGGGLGGGSVSWGWTRICFGDFEGHEKDPYLMAGVFFKVGPRKMAVLLVR